MVKDFLKEDCKKNPEIRRIWLKYLLKQKRLTERDLREAQKDLEYINRQIEKYGS